MSDGRPLGDRVGGRTPRPGGRYRRTGARQRPVGRDRQPRDPGRRRAGGVRPARRPARRARERDLRRPVRLGGVAEAREQRRVDRHAGRARRAAGGHRSRGPRAGDGAREPRGRSARLADRPVAYASARSGHVVELPARARAQGSRDRVRRGAAPRPAAHRRRRPQPAATRRSRPGSATRTSARWSGSCGGGPPPGRRLPSTREAHPARARRPERRLPAAVRDPARLPVGRRALPGGARRLGGVQPGRAEHALGFAIATSSSRCRSRSSGRSRACSSTGGRPGDRRW